jgi:hypothetical protein
MKKPLVIIALVVGVFLSASYAGAFIVSEEAPVPIDETEWIIGIGGLSFSFIADVAPLEYLVTLTDLSQAPFFGFDFLYLSITTATEFIDDRVGPGSLTFDAIAGEKYFVNIFGIGSGDYNAGLFGLKVAAIPIPASFLLFGSGVIAMLFLKRRKH